MVAWERPEGKERKMSPPVTIRQSHPPLTAPPPSLAVLSLVIRGNNPGAEVRLANESKGVTREARLQAWASGLISQGRNASKQIAELQV